MAVENPTPVTPLPTPVPQRGERSTFSQRVDGFVTWFTGTAIPQMAALVQNVYNNAVDAAASALSANSNRILAQAAAQSAVATPSAAATTTTSMQLGYGSKSFTLAQTNKTFSVGQIVSIASAADPRDWMAGIITAFTSGTGAMTVNVLNVGNATAGVFPTLASWIVSLTGAPAQTSQEQLLSFTPVPMPGADMDLSQGEYFTKTISGNTAFTFSNVPTGKSWTLELTITSGMISFPASVRWPGDLTPTLVTGKTHLIVFITDDGGTRVRAAALAGYTT